MPRPEWAVFISILSGASFSLFWISAVAYANDSAPEQLKSTAQGLLFSLLNLAGMVGSLGSGWLFDQAGPRGLFWGMTIIAAIALAIFVAGRRREGDLSTNP
jgi:MFS family permease